MNISTLDDSRLEWLQFLNKFQRSVVQPVMTF